MAGLMLDGGPCAGGFGWKGRTEPPERVVAAVAADGTTALFDLPDDQLELGEEAHEYRRLETIGPVHLSYRGRDRHLSGWWLTYEHVGPIGPERVAGYSKVGSRA